MEYCQYSDLSIYIKKRGLNGESHGIWGGLDEFVVRYFLGQLSSALEFLRQNQIIHRDLKPQNILLAKPHLLQLNNKRLTLVEEKITMLPVIKLGDFGFARSLTFQSLASTLCGSPLYMAPEILKGEKYDAKSDLWSVGTIIYEMLVGRAPFRAQNHLELLKKIELGWKFPEESMKRGQQISLSNKSPGRLYTGSLPASLSN